MSRATSGKLAHNSSRHRASRMDMGDPWPEPRSMADYTLDAAAPQMVACCGAAGVVRGAAGGCSRETTVNGVADNRPMPGIELPACLPAHHQIGRAHV